MVQNERDRELLAQDEPWNGTEKKGREEGDGLG
jgi:hypothetical protein